MRVFRPRIAADVPDGWVVRGTVELASPDLGARIVAFTEDLPPGATLDGYLAEHERMLNEHFPGFQELGVERLRSHSGADMVLRRFRWQPPDWSAVAQLQLYALERGRGLVVTASVEADRLATVEASLREVMLGIRFELPAGGDGPVVRTGVGPRERTYAALDAGVLTAGGRAS